MRTKKMSKEECIHPWKSIDITIDVYGSEYCGITVRCSECEKVLDINKNVDFSNSE